MFAVIYQGKVLEDMEELYKESWRVVAQYFIENCGAIGSALHKTEDGNWLAYSRWPDKATRNAAWPAGKNIAEHFPTHVIEAISNIKNSLFEQKEDLCMELVDDLL